MKLTIFVVVGLVLTLLASGCGDEGNVYSLEVGDCISELTNSQLSDVPIVDCSEPHEHEVYALWDVAGGSLPSEEDMTDGCIQRFEDAIGAPFTGSEIFASAITPTDSSFEQGDREVVCLSVEYDDAGYPIQVTGSVLGSER